MARSDTGWYVNRDLERRWIRHSGYALILHDLDGGWRLLVPRGFNPSSVGRQEDRHALRVSHVYERIPFSRKVNLIFEAGGSERTDPSLG